MNMDKVNQDKPPKTKRTKISDISGRKLYGKTAVNKKRQIWLEIQREREREITERT